MVASEAVVSMATLAAVWGQSSGLWRLKKKKTQKETSKKGTCEYLELLNFLWLWCLGKFNSKQPTTTSEKKVWGGYVNGKGVRE